MTTFDGVPAQTSALEVAKYLLVHARDHGEKLTNKKLQKLLYYCQAWYLVLTRTPLFGDRMEAWIHGPVVPVVYHEYKRFGYMGIDTPNVDAVTLDIEDRDIIDEVWDVYGKYDAAYLEWLSHNESPWLLARAGLDGNDTSNAAISNDSLFDYFSRITEATDGEAEEG